MNEPSVTKALQLQLSHVQMNVETAQAVNAAMDTQCSKVFERCGFPLTLKPALHGRFQQLIELVEVKPCERMPCAIASANLSQRFISNVTAFLSNDDCRTGGCVVKCAPECVYAVRTAMFGGTEVDD